MSLTIGDLVSYLGGPASAMLSDAPFKDWKVERSVEPELPERRIYYTFPNNGLDARCDARDKVATIFIYADEARRFEESIVDLPLTSTRREIHERLGPPTRSGPGLKDPIIGEFGAWDRFKLPGYSLHVEYRVGLDCIRMVTLMRDDVTP